MNRLQVLSALLAVSSFSAYAIQGDDARGPGDYGGRMNGMRNELFNEFKAVELYSHMERIRILQQAEACIQAATDRDQYRACEDREARAREVVKEQVKARHAQLRARIDSLRQGMALRP
ncbi:MAG TPA: hypothetical protein VMC81_02180 [Rhodocyclaceae bacterium]|nr:hypothetical protein [Rhodocyclaceae bacterium]